MNTENQISILNDLITRCYDAEKGYKEAAENVQSEQLKAIFQDYMNDRYTFGHQLKDEISKLGGEVEKGDSFAAKAHRVWIDIKSTLASNEDKAVLSEILRGEDYALEEYDSALKELPINSSSYDVVVNQRNNIRSAKNRMSTLKVIAEAPIES